jgi:hypothetical protein
MLSKGIEGALSLFTNFDLFATFMIFLQLLYMLDFDDEAKLEFDSFAANL